VRFVSAALLAGCVGCIPSDSPIGVARRFLDKYYVELDQQAALQVTTGPAERRVRDEIELLREARRSGLEPTVRPSVYYRKVRTKVGASDREREVEYELSIDGAGVKLKKRIRLMLENGEHGWKVREFLEADAAQAL
jgi:hypothetical protein